MITIEQLLESVDLDFEPGFVTKDKINGVRVWEKEPSKTPQCWTWGETDKFAGYEYLKLAEFDGKDWTKCIYEVPQKTPRKIELLKETTERVILWKINELVDAVNELKGNK